MNAADMILLANRVHSVEEARVLYDEALETLQQLGVKVRRCKEDQRAYAIQAEHFSAWWNARSKDRQSRLHAALLAKVLTR